MKIIHYQFSVSQKTIIFYDLSYSSSCNGCIFMLEFTVLSSSLLWSAGTISKIFNA